MQSITRKELVAILQRFDIYMTEQSAKELLDKIDVNGDGDVSWEELLNYLRNDLTADTVLAKVGGISMEQARLMIQRMEAEVEAETAAADWVAYHTSKY